MTPRLREYLETALWATSDEDGNQLEGRYKIKDFARSAVKEAEDELADFFKYAKSEIARTPLTAEQVAYNFYLTRNRYDDTFSDLGLGAVGEALSEKAHVYGTHYPVVGADGKLHFSG